MADQAGQYEIRGLNIDRVSKDYFEEALIFKKLVKVTPTSARENRYYQKTSGYLTATSPAKISPIAAGTRPFVLQQSWTRSTAHVRKFMLDSARINMEDETDNDVQVLLKTAQDVTAAVAYNLDAHIWDIASESQSPSNINSVTSTAAWDAGSGQDPFEDIMECKQVIREQTKRKLRNGVLLVSAKGEKDLLVWLVSTKGSSIPNMSSDIAGQGQLMNFAGLSLITSENVTADYAMVGDLSEAVEYKEFKPLTTVIIDEPGIGKVVRCWAEGVAILVKPKFLALISNTEA